MSIRRKKESSKEKKIIKTDIKGFIKKKLIIGIAVLAMFAGAAIPAYNYIDNNVVFNEQTIDTQNIYLSAEDAKNVLQVHFIDVGQGDSILIKQYDEAMLIDAGERSMGSEVVKYCEKEGISELKYVVGTHMHEDHIGGMSEVISNIQVDNIVLTETDYTTDVSDKMLNIIREKSINEIYPQTGDTFMLGDADILVAAPNRHDYRDENNKSIILKVTYGDISYLFCGDAEIESEYDMAENGLNISANVIKVGHHGSESSTSQMLLKTVKPQYAVISVGRDNSYGHPSSKIISRLEEYGIKYLRTDTQGTIVSITDGENIMWGGTVDKTDYKNTDYKNTDYEGTEYKNTEINSTEDNSENTYDYVINTNTRKFHKPDCESVEDILDKNRENYSGERENLIKEGYTPCKRCNP